MRNLKRIALLFIVCCQFLSLAAQKDMPKWAEKAKKAVVSIDIFNKSGEKIRTGHGFFIDEKGSAVSDYALFKGAAKAVVTDMEGKQMPVTSISGADALYDVICFRVEIPKKVAYLPLSEELIVTGAEVYLLPFEGTINKGAISEISKLKENYNYYKIEMPLDASQLSAPLLTAKGEVFGIAQTDASGENKTYAIGVPFIKSLRVGSSDLFNRTYADIDILKAWPESPDDAQIALFLYAGKQDAKTYLETLNNFIATFPGYTDVYFNRASHYIYNRTELAATEAEQSKLLDLAKEDVNTALKLDKKTGNAYFNEAKLIYGVAVNDSVLRENGWTIDVAKKSLAKAIAVEDLPVYRQLEADIYFYQKQFQQSYDLYMIVNKSDIASPSSFYWAAKAKQNIEGSSIGDVIALMDSAVVRCGTSLSNEAAGYILESVELKMQLGQYKEAIDDYNKYYKLMNGNVNDSFYYFREQAAFLLGDLDAAMRDIEDALILSPRNAVYHAEQASIHVRKKEFDDAMASIKKALEIQPDFAACYRLLGVCNLRLNKKDEACVALKKAKELGDSVADKLIKENCK